MKLNKHIIRQKMRNKDVLYDPETSELYSLNEVGKKIFELALSGMTEEDIVKEITKDYEVTQKDAEKDVKSFLTILSKKKLLK